MWYGISLWLVWASYPAPSAPCALPAVGQYEKLQYPWLTISSASQQLKYLCVIDIMIIQNSKHSTTSATRKELTLSQTKLGQCCTYPSKLNFLDDISLTGT